jgi:hypothetical protein
MGLKGYRLWGMGQLDSNVQSPTEEAHVQRVAVGHHERDGGLSVRDEEHADLLPALGGNHVEGVLRERAAPLDLHLRVGVARHVFAAPAARFRHHVAA